MDDDDLLGEMLDFVDVTPATATPPVPSASPSQAPPGQLLPQRAPPQALLRSPQVAGGSAPSPSPSRASISPGSAVPSLQQQHHFQNAAANLNGMLMLMYKAAPEKQADARLLQERVSAAVRNHKGDFVAAYHALVAIKDDAKKVYGQQVYDLVKLQYTNQHGAAAAAQQRAPFAPQAAASSPGGAARAPTPTPAAQQQVQARQAAAAGPARAQSPFPVTAAMAGVVAGQPVAPAAGMQHPGGLAVGQPSSAMQQLPFPQQSQLTPAQVAQAAQASQAVQAAQAANTAAAAAAAAQAAAAAKRPAEGAAEQAAAKRAKPAASPAAKRREDGEGLTVDDLIDFDQETNQLMEGLQRDRREGRVRSRTTSNQQFLSDWRIGHEFYRQIQRTGGGLRVKGECFEVVQLAFQAHMSALLARALRCAQHRQDVARRSVDVAVTADPRRGVAQIERRERAKAEAKAEVERAELLRMAGSKKADEELKERAQKAKAELVGKQQASLANAAVAATLGGKSKSKLNKWDKWAAAGGPASAAAAGDSDGAAAVAAAAAGGKKKGGAGGKKGGKKGAGGAAAESEGEGAPTTSAAGSDASGAAAAAAAAGGTDKPSSTAKAPAPRSLLAGSGTGGSEDASTVHLRDVLATLERDPMYCHSDLLYRLYNTPRAAASTIAGQP